MSAASTAQDVRVYEQASAEHFIYRGTRRLLQATVSHDVTRVSLIFSEALDRDDGFRFGLLAPPTSVTTEPEPTALSLEVISLGDPAIFEKLSPQSRALLLLPPGASRFNRTDAYREAQSKLVRLKFGDAAWDDLTEWLIKNKPKFDQELLEEILVMVLNSPWSDKGKTIQLAYGLIGDLSPASPKFAKEFAIALGDVADKGTSEWGMALLELALQDRETDHELLLAGARLAFGADDFARSCNWYAQAATEVPLGPADLTVYLMSSMEVGASAMSAAAEAANHAIADRSKPDDLYPYASVLDDLAMLEKRQKGRWIERIEQILHLLAQFDPLRAWRMCEAYCAMPNVRLADKLLLLSILEVCEAKEAVQGVFDSLLLLLEVDLFRQTDDSLIEDAIRQLRLTEEAVGDFEHEASNEFSSRLRERLSRLDTAASSDLETAVSGKLVVLVGGRDRTRSKVAETLVKAGAKLVRELPSSWERSIDKGQISEAVRDAHIVATVTDCMKHDASVILRSLQASGMDFRLVRTAGGPSHIVRDILRTA